MTSAQKPAPAVKALQYASQYDSMRLETYREKESLAHRIRILRIGSAVALRFDDVGYFNRVYGADETVFDNLAEIEEFYRGGPFGCELVGPPLDSGRRIARPRWRPANSYAWMHSPGCGPQPRSDTGDF